MEQFHKTKDAYLRMKHIYLFAMETPQSDIYDSWHIQKYVDEPICTMEEQKVIVDWITTHHKSLLTNRPNVWYTYFHSSPIELPPVLYELRQRIIEKEGLHGYSHDPVLNDFINYIDKQGQIHYHKDHNFLNRLVHVRYNIILQRSSGTLAGCPITEGIIHDVPERCYWRLKAGEVFHSCVNVCEGDMPRIGICFGFMIPEEVVEGFVDAETEERLEGLIRERTAHYAEQYNVLFRKCMRIMDSHKTLKLYWIPQPFEYESYAKGALIDNSIDVLEAKDAMWDFLDAYIDKSYTYVTFHNTMYQTLKSDDMFNTLPEAVRALSPLLLEVHGKQNSHICLKRARAGLSYDGGQFKIANKGAVEGVQKDDLSIVVCVSKPQRGGDIILNKTVQSYTEGSSWIGNAEHFSTVVEGSDPPAIWIEFFYRPVAH